MGYPMTVALCLEVHQLPADVIASVLDVLVQWNIQLYRGHVVAGPPWDLRWVPDQLVICDADSGVCRFADTSKLQDVSVLYHNGEGSCGPLACAYAAYLVAVERKQAVVRLSSEGRDRWHVVARVGDRIYDPQTIGAR